MTNDRRRMKLRNPPSLLLGLLLLTSFAPGHAIAFDYEGHRAINQIALSSLPTNYPSFTRTPAALERIAFLGGEPDRWRNAPDLALRQANGPDHYIDLEDLPGYGLKPETLPVFRYDFVAQLARERAAHPQTFPVIDAARNEDHTRELVGFLPWAIAENFAKLKSSFSYLKALEANGAPEEIANAQQNVLYVMGVLSHFVGDAAQPLHTTHHHHGWIGANPNHYTTNTAIHRWIDGEYFLKSGGFRARELQAQARSAVEVGSPGKAEDLFRSVVAFILEQHQQVEPLYQLDKAGKLSAEGEINQEGRAFLEKQLGKGGQMLGDLWFSAWKQAPEDTFLKGQLTRRKLGNGAERAAEPRSVGK
jgi:hypothetical protein